VIAARSRSSSGRLVGGPAAAHWGTWLPRVQVRRLLRSRDQRWRHSGGVPRESARDTGGFRAWPEMPARRSRWLCSAALYATVTHGGQSR